MYVSTVAPRWAPTSTPWAWLITVSLGVGLVAALAVPALAWLAAGAIAGLALSGST